VGFKQTKAFKELTSAYPEFAMDLLWTAMDLWDDEKLDDIYTTSAHGTYTLHSALLSYPRIQSVNDLRAIIVEYTIVIQDAVGQS
jgi:hypothetical protein